MSGDIAAIAAQLAQLEAIGAIEQHARQCLKPSGKLTALEEALQWYAEQIVEAKQ